MEEPETLKPETTTPESGESSNKEDSSILRKDYILNLNQTSYTFVIEISPKNIISMKLRTKEEITYVYYSSI